MQINSWLSAIILTFVILDLYFTKFSCIKIRIWCKKKFTAGD